MANPATIAEIEAELALGAASRYNPRWLKAELRRLRTAGAGSGPRIVTCQYTGVQFEATSSRQKNHPAVSALLNDANKAGPAAYGAAKAALEAARASGQTDIDAIVSAARRAAFGAQADADQARADQRQARADARSARAAANEILRAGGYHWHKEDEESMDFAGPNAFSGQTWTLTAPDGGDVSVREAMQELAARGVVRAQQWLRSRGA